MLINCKVYFTQSCHWGLHPSSPCDVPGVLQPTAVLELGSVLNNDRWTVQVGVGHNTENEMCNVHVHNVMFIEFILFKSVSVSDKWPLTVGLPSTRAGRRTDIIKPGYPGTRVWRPSNPQTRGFKKAPGFAFPRCHSPHRNISTNYYFVVEMLTVTVRSDDARYLLKNSTNCLV